MPLAGTLVEGHYRLVRPLGRGASSVVYLAVGQDGQPYAIKLFPPELTSRAEREYAVAHELDHVNLGRVKARVDVQGQPGLVLDFARGVVVFQRYARRPALATERAAFVRTLTNVLAGLGYLHERGMVHRDVKPENVIVQPDGAARLVDFDLSGPRGEDFGLPVRIGTAAFLSPEAERGEDQTAQSDLYGVGLLLYWGLHGELPFDGAPRRTNGDPLATLCEELLAEEPGQRPASAQDAAARLAALC